MRIVDHTASLIISGLILPTLVLGAPDGIDIFGTFVSRSTNSATVSWNTSPHTKGYVSYAGPNGVWKDTPWSQDYLAKHEITILQLDQDTTYLYRINSEDSEGLLKTYSGTFSTLTPFEQTNTSTTDTSVTGSFQALLSPSPTPATIIQNTPQGYNPNIQYIPYVIPLQIAITQTPLQQTTTQPILGAFDANQPNVTTIKEPLNITLVFILGLLLGVILITLATHTLPKRQPTTSPEKHKENKPQEFNFTVKE